MDGDSKPAAPTTPESPGDGVPASLLAEWRAAEERLYPVVLVIPEAYERVVRLVGEVTVELQLSCPDTRSLVAAGPGVAERIRQLAEAGGGGDRLDFPLIAAAACLMRYRQLKTETRRDQRRKLIAEAVESGAEWVTLEQGAVATAWPAIPTATLEMHLARGEALEQTIAMDASTGAPIFRLTELALDPATGERQGEEVAEEEFDDPRQWRAAISERRQMIEGNH